MAFENLFELLHAGQANQFELEQLMLMHFGQAYSEGDEQVFNRGGEQPALSFSYRDGVLVKILPGPALQQVDVNTLRSMVENDLLKSDRVKVARAVLFAAVPVTEAFNYRERFQILPVPSAAPRPSLLGGNPFLLEFKFPSTSKAMVDMARRADRARECELLIAGLLTNFQCSQGSRMQHHWVLTDLTQMRSEYLQGAYAWPGMTLLADGYTPLDGIAPFEHQAPQTYYNRFRGRADKLRLPTNFGEQLDRYFGLPIDIRQRFLRACFWFRHAHHVHHFSRSATFTALISAVEALMLKASAATCTQCGQRIGPGPTQQFAGFVEKFASGISNSERKRFYGIRSALSHGGKLLHSDYNDWWSGGDPELWDRLRVENLVRIVLVNWLASQTNGANQ